jgi:hypothetical protein
MTLGKHLIEQLRLLAAGESVLAKLPTDGDRSRLVIIDQPAQATLEFFDHDRYSVTLRALDVSSGMPFEGDARTYLSAHAAVIARQLNYLEEPLAVWELDGTEQVAQLRSSPPQREGEELSYWEVTLRADEPSGARIMRYRWAPDMAEREVVAYPATFALVGRLADSLATALQSDQA